MLLLIVTISINIVFIFLIAFKGSNKISNKIFISFIVGVVAWSTSIYFFTFSLNDLFLLATARLAFLAAAAIACSFLFFVKYFPKKLEHNKGFAKILNSKALYFPPVAMILLTTTPLIISKVEKLDGQNIAVHGLFYNLLALYLVTYFVIGLIALIKKYSYFQGIYKKQIQYVFLGFLISITIAVLTNLVYPLITKSSALSQFGPASTIILFGFITYSIVRYRLLNIKLVITRSLLYFFLIVVVTGTFVGGLFLAGKFFTDQGMMGDLGAAVVVALAVVFLFDPMKKLFARTTDSIFYKDKIDYQEVTRDVTQVINREIELKDLAEKVAGTLKERMKLREAFLLLSVGKDCFLRPGELERETSRKRYHQRKKTVYYSSALIKYLNKTKDEVVTDELERMMLDEQSERKQKQLQKVLNDLQALEAAMVVPIFQEKNMTAILVLGRKMSGDVFSNDEFRLLEVISPQIASSLEKSKLYQEVKSFNVKLQKEVEKATSELKDVNLELGQYNEELSNKNKNLGTLQKFAKDILQEVEFEKLAHKLIDALPGEISYCRTALLTLVDERKKELHGVTIPQNTKMAEKIFKLVGKDISKYGLSLNKKDNLLVKAVLTGKEQVSDDLADFLNPPLPKEATREIQNIEPKMKSAVAFPLMVSGKALGVLHFSLTKDIKEVSQENMNMLRAVADEVALAIERAQYFEKMKKLNSQLKTANKNLKELDKAKSEFMSIASHQLRTPLTGVMGYLSMILNNDYGKMKKEQREVIKEVFEATQRLIRLVNIFLNITRIEAGRFVLTFADTDMKELVEKEVHELMPNAEKKGLKLNYHGPKKKIPIIKADSDKIKDIVINLVDNAIKYTEKGSIDVYLDKTDSMVELIVKDTGVGIAPSEAKKLFQKFVRAGGGAKIDASGSGLGLYILKRITEAHGGKVKVESEGAGKGTKFMVWIPIKPKKK